MAGIFYEYKQTCFDTDDALLLLDYFKGKNEKQYTLNGIIKDAQLEDAFGKAHLYGDYEEGGIDCCFWLYNGSRKYRADFQMPINLLIYLSPLVLQSIVEKIVRIKTKEMTMVFSISAEKNEINMMIAELENAVQNPHLYYPDFLQEEFIDNER